MSNKTSDKNVENIETVIKDCREHLKLYGEAFITADELDRIEKILAEREQDKKRIQELEKENEELLEVKISCSAVNIIENLQKENKSKQKAYDDCYCEYKKYKQFESIPKQVVIDELKRLSDMLNKTTEGRIQKYTVNEIIIRSNTLQELLEGEK